MKLKILQVREAKGESIQSPDVVANIMKSEAKADRECFWVLHLNGANMVIEKELISMGSLSASVVHMREVFKKVVINGTDSIISVHNHPSGRCDPSPEDRAIWERLNKAGELLGIAILDHLIITLGGSFYSEKHGGAFKLNRRKEK